MNDLITFPSQESKATRDGYGEALVELGEANPEVVVVCADVSESTRSADFAKRFPDRFFEVGVAEQNLVGVAAGLALEGFIPFAASYAVFNPGRNWEQIRISICYSNLHVIVVGSHAGLVTGADGASHQGLEDIALTRVLPNMTVLVPADVRQAKAATLASVDWPGPIYLRLTREKTPVFYHRDAPYKIGEAEVLREGTDVTMVACGPIAYEALLAAEQLAKPRIKANLISAEVINVHTIKPLDVNTLLRSAKKTGRVVTVEEHQITGGLGSAVAEALSEEYPVPIKRVGMPDSFGESGEPDELLKKYRMAKDDIVKAVLNVVG